MPQSARRPWDHLRGLAIAEEPGRRALITTAQGHSSSFLPPRLDIDRNDIRTATGAEVVTCRRLDELGEVHGALAIHLKIDVQGMELDVYRSAGEMADRIVSLELELSLVELYEGQPLIEVVMDHLRRDGFAPVALTRGYTAPIRWSSVPGGWSLHSGADWSRGTSDDADHPSRRPNDDERNHQLTQQRSDRRRRPTPGDAQLRRWSSARR